MEIEVARTSIMEASKQLVTLGLVARTWGNVSCRVGEGDFLITPSGKPYEQLQEEQLVLVDLEDLSYPKGVKPSSEKKLHREVYKLKKEVGCVIHTHQEMASLAGLLGRDIPVSKEGTLLLGEVIPVARYGLPGTNALVKNASRSITANSAKSVLLANHGSLCFGSDAAKTLEIAKQLEVECRAHLARLVPLFGEEDSEKAKTQVVALSQLGTDTAQSQAAIPKRAALIASLLVSDKSEQRTILYHSSPAVVEVGRRVETLPSYLDDFAQIAGTKIAVLKSGDKNVGIVKRMGRKCNALLIQDEGALCWATTEADASAVAMILEKNCKAALLALEDPTVKPISWLDTHLMRLVYLKKYSKIAESCSDGV